MKILILGYGRTGKAVYDFIKKYHHDVYVFDENVIDDLKEYYYSYERLKKELPLFDLCIRSPGITRTSKAYFLAFALSKRLISELEFSLYFLKSKHIIGVTGTNGKTTTCLMIKTLLDQKYKTRILGNYGTPLIEQVEKIKEDEIIILELSSFMLEDTFSLKCEVSVITSLSENHLDHTYNLETYYGTKKRILFNNPDLIVKDDRTIDSRFLTDKLSKINNINLEKAIRVAKYYLLDDKLIHLGISQLKLLSYRQEIIKVIGDLIFVNDSKSTTIESTKSCIDQFSDKSNILILEGNYKGQDISEIYNLSVNEIYSYGNISFLLNDKVNKKNNLREILLDIKKKYLNGYILFSPIGASFDLYKSYQDRGDEFNRLVDEIWK